MASLLGKHNERKKPSEMRKPCAIPASTCVQEVWRKDAVPFPYSLPFVHVVLTVLQTFIEIESIARSFCCGKIIPLIFNHL